MTTTEETVYRNLLTDLKTGLSSPPESQSLTSIDAAQVYISIAPFHDDRFDECVQLIPGTPAPKHPVAGRGLVMDEFMVSVWKRVALDVGQEATSRLVDDSFGCIARLSAVRAILIQHIVTGSAVPITWIRTEKATEPEHGFIWCQRADIYRFGYTIEWPAT